ncbi:MAG: 16S rRNA pseudouridine(516) synthase [Planctomycetes bacterium]|nr:16S rRNA pseudouridine(516) synthase [Planctomycetota bacterium]
MGSDAVVTLDGAVVTDGIDDSVLICHKPAGVACSHLPADAPLLYDLVPPAWRHPDLQAAGRLDRDTTGLIVLTIDGALIQRLTWPVRALWKRYRIRFVGELLPAARGLVASGLTLPDDPLPCLPARLLVPDDDEGGATGPEREAVLELCEGRHHQVKRMIRALGGRVTGLHRDRIGDLDLPSDLAPGAMRPATAAELARRPEARMPEGSPERHP